MPHSSGSSLTAARTYLARPLRGDPLHLQIHMQEQLCPSLKGDSSPHPQKENQHSNQFSTGNYVDGRRLKRRSLIHVTILEFHRESLLCGQLLKGEQTNILLVSSNSLDLS